MNLIKHILLKLRFRWKRTLLLLVLFTAAFSLLVVEGILYYSARQQLDALDVSFGRSLLVEKVGDNQIDADVRGTFTESEISALTSSEYAESYNLLSVNSGFLEGMTPYVTDEAQYAQWLESKDITADSMDNGMFFGVRNSETCPLFSGAGYHLVQGNAIRPEDEGKAVVLISDTLAKTNALHIGDSITLRASRFSMSSSTQTFTIQGIFSYPEQDYIQSYDWRPIYHPANQVILPQDMLTSMGSLYYGLSQVYITLDDIEDANAYIAEMTQTLGESTWDDTAYCETFYTYTSNRERYEMLSPPMEEMTYLTAAMLVMTGLGLLVVFILIVVWMMRGNLREIGLLMAMGQQKCKLGAQLFLELVIPIVLSAALAIAIGAAAAPAVSGEAVLNLSEDLNAQIVAERLWESKNEYGNDDYLLLVDIQQGGFGFLSSSGSFHFGPCAGQLIQALILLLIFMAAIICIQIWIVFRKPVVHLLYRGD